MFRRIKHTFLIPGLAALLSLGLISTPLQAATYTVCPTGCNYTTIGAAIANASSGDTIVVGAGTYNENVTIDRNVQIVGAGMASTIIHGDNTASVVTINAGVVAAIAGVTIENGAGNVTLPTSVPTGPTDKSGRRVGGGIDNDGTLTLSSSLVQSNTVVGESGNQGGPGRYTSLGGGIYNASGANLTLDHVSIVNNRAVAGNSLWGGGGGGGFGGGIYNEVGGVLDIRDGRITGNSALGGHTAVSQSVSGMGGGGAGLGGGLFNNGASTIANTSIGENSAIGGNAEDGTGDSQSWTYPGGGGFGGQTVCDWVRVSCIGHQGGFGGGGSGADYGRGDPGGAGGFGGGGGLGRGASGNGGFGGGGASSGLMGVAGVGGFGGGYGKSGGHLNYGGGAGAGIGGGIFVNGGPVTVDGGAIYSNVATGGNAFSGGGGFGGGLFSNGIIVVVNNSYLQMNSARSGTSNSGGTSIPSRGRNCAVGDGTGGSTAGGRFAGSNNRIDGEGCSFGRVGNDLYLIKTVVPTTPILPGTPITYTLTFSNAGTSAAAGVVITDSVPMDVITGVTVISSGVTITATGYVPAYVWQVQDLAPSQIGVITITGVLNDLAAAGVFTNTATVSSTTADADPTDNQSEVSTTAILPPALAITKTVTTANNPAQPGDVLTYTIVVANSGGSEALGVRITDTLPAYVNGANLDETATVAAGEKITFTIDATLDSEAPYGEVITNTAYYSYTGNSSEDTAGLTVAGPPQLAISKTVELSNNPAQPGNPLTYTVVVANAGASNAVGAVISDTLPAYITGADLYQVVNIAAGESLTFTLNVNLDHSVPLGEIITNTVSFSHTSGSGQASSVFSVKETEEIYLPIILSDR